MAMDKAIEHRKEKRKPYYKSGKVDRSCRPGGNCPYCRSNRQYRYRKADEASKEQMQ